MNKNKMWQKARTTCGSGGGGNGSSDLYKYTCICPLNIPFTVYNKILNVEFQNEFIAEEM